MTHRLGPMRTLPSPMRRFAETETVDYCIVGVGSAGGVLVQRLARAGFRVVASEAGPFWDTERDWVSDEKGSHGLYWNDLRITEELILLHWARTTAARVLAEARSIGRLSHRAFIPLTFMYTRKTALVPIGPSRIRCKQLQPSSIQPMRWCVLDLAKNERVALKIEDYALIGDCETAALIGKIGSIDWLCWPDFSSPACFAALIGTEQNGYWLLTPRDPIRKVTRRNRDHTLILESRFETESGVLLLTDFMPVREAHSDIVRVAQCTQWRSEGKDGIVRPIRLCAHHSLGWPS